MTGEVGIINVSLGSTGLFSINDVFCRGEMTGLITAQIPLGGVLASIYERIVIYFKFLMCCTRFLVIYLFIYFVLFACHSNIDVSSCSINLVVLVTAD